ncbi:hypothetical protein [Pseudalkalibacillus salsuginis]|uniref:hypothetical protein n=1 Tax=Pseudalkalibacillus salsuginis TaxID=2910972 RepID=UPI001F2EE5A0|nr:hypothetical protein [Pseudalkalibacillus salsuginis]MCF6411435.1 hypothetical protein [Pseudalkalibacillus salsuginis]
MGFQSSLSTGAGKKTISAIKTRWIRYAVILWTFIYGGLGMYWSIGGEGYPFGLDQDAAGSFYRHASSEMSGAVIAILSVLGIIALLSFGRMSSRFVRRIIIGFSWSMAVILCLTIPDARLLIGVAYAPVALIGGIFGGGIWSEYLDTITWPIINQWICLTGGLLWGAAAVSLQRQFRNACLHCGIAEDGNRRKSMIKVERWGRWITYVAIIAPLFYDITRLAWLLGIPLGISGEQFQILKETGAISAGAGLAFVSIGGAILTHGLISPWGEVFPKWIPFAGGKRVPPAVAIVPAGLVSVLITVMGMQVVCDFKISDATPDWGAVTPLLLFPVWGIALGGAVVCYYYRRRVRCNECGR